MSQQEAKNGQNEARLQEIFYELSECREDERSSQNQIVQVLVAVATILGIVFAFRDINDDKFYLLFICSLVFSVAFAFIITLGIGNVLRYHYIQDLEDRLDTLVPCGMDRAELVHWMSFSSPVVTRNPKHLNSKYSKIHFFCYAMATVSSILFCLFIIFFLYKQIEKPSNLAKVAIVLSVVFMAASIIIFFYSCIKAKDMYKFALNTSVERKQKRIRERSDQQNVKNKLSGDRNNISESAPSTRKYSQMNWFRVLIYFIYPKIKDLQKVFLIVLGYIMGVVIFNVPISMENVKYHGIRVVWIVLVMDGLLYQARYQWNDIRGIWEDAAMGKRDRLPVDVLGKKLAVIISLILLFARMCVAFYFIIRFGQDLRIPLLVCAGLIVIISILYETVRQIQCIIGVFLVVGLGYPLRVLVGIWSVCPELWNSCGLASGMPVYESVVICLLIAFFFYGEFCVTIPWSCEALEQIHRSGTIVKKHYRYLFEKLQDRINQPLWLQSQDVFSPMRTKGKLSDLWNWSYLASMIALSIASEKLDGPWWFLLLEVTLILIVAKQCCVQQKVSVFYFGTAIALIVLKMIWLFLREIGGWMSICICACQLFFAVLYYLLRYHFDPEFNFLILLFEIVVGKRTYQYLKDD